MPVSHDYLSMWSGAEGASPEPLAYARPRPGSCALGLMDDHARHCVIDGPADLKDGRTEELMAPVARLLRRG